MINQNALDIIVPVCLALEEVSPSGILKNAGSVQSFDFEFASENDLISFTKQLLRNPDWPHKHTKNIIRDGLKLVIPITN